MTSQKLIYTLFCLIFIMQLQAQVTRFEADFKDYTNKSAKAKKYKIKTITKTYSTRDNGSHSHVISKEVYDATGNILYIAKGKNDTTTFIYTNNQLSAIKTNTRQCNLFECEYNDQGQLSYIKQPYCNPNNNFSICYFFYRPDGQVDYKVYGNNDTTTYYYDEQGKWIPKLGNQLPTTTAGPNNTKLIVYDIGTVKEEYVEDSLGNQLAYKWKITNNKDIWQTIIYSYASFTDTLCTEFHHYSYPYGNHNKSRGQLRLKTHVKYEYNTQGLLLNALYYTRHGKLDYVEAYSYEFW